MVHKSIIGATCAYIISLGLASTANAALIQVGLTVGASQLNAFEPLGQSFTAEDRNVLFGFNLEVMNSNYPNDPIRFTLYEGQGFGGAVLDAQDITAPTGVNGYFDVDFSAIDLSIGQFYTVGASVVGDSPYWGVAQSLDLYAGGNAYSSGVATAYDWSFRVSPVPVPAAVWLFGSGLIGLIGVARRKHST